MINNQNKNADWFRELAIKIRNSPTTPEKEAFFKALEKGKYGVRPEDAWDTMDTGFLACCAEDCPKKDNCRCWLVYEYITRRNLIGHTITIGDPSRCATSYKPLK